MQRVREITLVERPAPRTVPGSPRVRRYALARIAPSPISALGVDRHERLERAAEVRPVAAGDPLAAAPDPAR